MKSKKYNRFGLVVLSFFIGIIAILTTSCEDNTEVKYPDGVTRIFVKSMPKVAYALDAPIDFSGMVLAIERGEVTTEVPFTEFEKEGITIDPPNGTVLSFEHHSITITHKPSGKGIVQPIDVTNIVDSMSVNTPPVINYEVADTLNLTDLVINLIKENGESRSIGFNEFKDELICVPAQGDTLAEGIDKIVITYLPTDVKIEININVNPFTPQSSVVKVLPNNVDYNLGEKLHLNGLVMEYVFSSGTSKEVPFELFGFYGIETSVSNTEVLGNSDNLISVFHSPSGTSAEFTINLNPVLEVKSLQVKELPLKLFYKAGELIDLSGLEVRITRNDNVILDIPQEYFYKVGLSTTPDNGATFDLSIPNVAITHDGSGISTKSPLKVAIPASALDVKLEEVSPAKWSLKNHFDEGVNPYSDRNYEIANFPMEFRGLQWIQTTMDLIFDTDEQVASLNLDGAYTVYFVHCLGNKLPPSWVLDNWESTSLRITLDNKLPYSIYKKDFEKGEEVKLFKFANPTSKPAPPYFLILERR